MDFQFTHFQGNVIAKCSMEHIAVANWFNTELPNNPELISTALEQVRKAQNWHPMQEYQILGKEYSLFIEADSVTVRANNLDCLPDELIEQNLHQYLDESIAVCGLEDFENFLISYLAFINSR